ncbi:MAG: hypothetical protein ABSG94_01525 [Brevinematales bacterium]|jgi:hypothetical protein
MNEYIELKGLWEKGEVHLLEKPDRDIKEHTEIKVIFPIHSYEGITVKKFLDMKLHCSLGGDAVKETEHLYND